MFECICWGCAPEGYDAVGCQQFLQTLNPSLGIQPPVGFNRLSNPCRCHVEADNIETLFHLADPFHQVRSNQTRPGVVQCIAGVLPEVFPIPTDDQRFDLHHRHLFHLRIEEGFSQGETAPEATDQHPTRGRMVLKGEADQRPFQSPL